jgi:hypothetical protein
VNQLTKYIFRTGGQKETLENTTIYSREIYKEFDIKKMVPEGGLEPPHP